ncbi:helix-turn-helix domain-containing protein [Mycolicibacterium mageritense]|uniref:helix-turn-helix domain-containing protein n=1 Tax=Mycolicibacterium mageritense TaxID=53462 RepID=UPI001E3B3D52|nr:helix-turn-helix domain-containing protein [Mycolicibacterium mageritense]GJJ19908.1 hypothetical protein MTY414_35810 [Mycolicibacterium mageritense]
MVDAIGHIRDDDLGDVMTLGPMYKTDDAVAFLRERVGIPDVTPRRLSNARRRGEIVASVFGQSVVFAERDLLAWIASLYGNSEEYRASMSESLRAAKAANRSR